MSEEFKVEIVNPEKSFLSKEDVIEVVVPAFEGEMGILKDHISIISFLKPGIITIQSKSGEDKFFIEDGIVEFKNNNLSILTSSIFNLKDVDKDRIQNLIKIAEEETSIKNVKLIKEFDGFITYHLPDHLLGIIWKGKFRGQEQKWFLMRYLGKDNEINIKTKKPEFLEWKWVDLKLITELVVDFKLDVYKEVQKKVQKIIN